MAHFSEKDDLVVTVSTGIYTKHAQSHVEGGYDEIDTPLNKKAYPTGRGDSLPAASTDGELFYNRSEEALYIVDEDEWKRTGVAAGQAVGIRKVEFAKYTGQSIPSGSTFVVGDVDVPPEYDTASIVEVSEVFLE